MDDTLSSQTADAGEIDRSPAQTRSSGGAARLADYRIDDLKSFESVTGEPHQLAGLYFYQQLDCLVDLAHAVSHDFFKRSHRYINLGRTQPKDEPSRPLRQTLAQLRARYGYDELFPSVTQRDEIYLPIFGSRGGYAPTEEGDFPRLRNQLLDAAATFAERVFDTGEDMLRAAVRTTHRPMSEYLQGLHGDSVRWNRENALAGLTEAVSYPVLRSSQVSGVFGIQPPPVVDWPYTEDSNGTKLVEAMSQQLEEVDRPGDTNLSRERISNLQRAALRGAEAIATIIDYRESPDKADLDRLITKCYTWRAALLSVDGIAEMAQPANPMAANTRAAIGRPAYTPT
jgi:hypothetical protein